MQNLIDCPLDSIDAWFQEERAKTGEIPGQWSEKERILRTVSWDEIPSLNSVPLVENLPLRSLVRYRGMVQESCGPEIYAATLNDGSKVINMKYRDVCSAEHASTLTEEVESNVLTGLRERDTYYCVPIPGESVWAREAPSSVAVPSVSTSRPKRTRDDIDTGEDIDMENDGGNKAIKEATKPMPPPMVPACASTKVDYNLPLPEEADIKRTRCSVVKTYDSDGKDLRVMDVIDVIAILHMDWIEYPEDWKTGTRGISYALAPRLHAISVTRRPYFNPAPMMPDMCVTVVRDALLQYLKYLVGGDELVSRYVLCALIQREFKRLDGVSYGTLALGLQLDAQQASVFTEGIRSLMPYVAALPVSIETLSSSRWVPKKNYDTETVMAGLLQLAPGTVVILNENALGEGKLMETGLKNLSLIKSYIANNAVDADFEFYPVSLPTYHTNFVLSAGKAPLIVPDVMCPIVPAETPCVTPDETLLATFRSYLARCVEVSNCAMSFEDSLVDQLPKDYSNMRQKHAKLPDTMCNIFTVLARFNAISRGATQISVNHWHEILEMEEMRMPRLA